MSLENSQEDFIDEMEHKDRMVRIMAFVSKKISINTTDNKEASQLTNNQINKVNVEESKPKLEPIPDISHLQKRKTIK